MISTVSEAQKKSQKPSQSTGARVYTRAPGTAYLLPSDEEERQRLFVQHNLIEQSFGGLIHVAVPLTGSNFILESATGTGVWLLDIAKRVPATIQLIGIDIELRLFPNRSTLPPNIHFQVQSVLKMPENWTKKFSFVHQRLLIAALRTSERPQALNEIHQVMKPGRWIQLVEVDDWVSGPVMEIFHSLMIRLGESRGITMWPGVVPLLKAFLDKAGFMNIRIMRSTSPVGRWAGRNGEIGRDNMMALFRGIKAPVLEAGGFGIVKSGTMYDKLLDRVALEMDSTPSGEIGWVILCARKA